MTKVKIDSVTKYFGDVRGVDNANIEIEDGEFFTLLGPSGCGKTTLLRTLAGFYRHEEGHIYFDNDCIDDIPAYKRNIGMVFQNYAIFPHLTVSQNVAYGLKARKVGKKEIEKRVLEALEMVELEHLKDRSPSQLSGGQQQRIALARSIVIHPGLLLMDEPLSNLDAKLRVKMRSEIRDLQKKLKITTIYVTHDQEEALSVSDRIAVINKGKIQQIGKPHEIYLAPKNQFVANFIGKTNFLEAECQYIEDEKTLHDLKVSGITLQMNFKNSYSGESIFSIRPEQIKIIDDNNENLPVITGEISDVVYLGEKMEYTVSVGGSEPPLTIYEYNNGFSRIRNIGDHVNIYLNPKAAILYDRSGEEALNIDEHVHSVGRSKAV
ncbi:MAG: ABC transporter ATP-binding protein [Tuberibacillus sp.]